MSLAAPSRTFPSRPHLCRLTALVLVLLLGLVPAFGASAGPPDDPPTPWLTNVLERIQGLWGGHDTPNIPHPSATSESGAHLDPDGVAVNPPPLSPGGQTQAAEDGEGGANLDPNG